MTNDPTSQAVPDPRADPVSRRPLRLMWLGFATYAISFFLVATPDLLGYTCAIGALILPFDPPTHTPRDPSRTHPFGREALFISGMINVVFPLVFLLGLTPFRGAFKAARVLVPLMTPFSWLVFFYLPAIPREGHALWVTGMLLALFSDEIAARWGANSTAPGSGAPHSAPARP